MILFIKLYYILSEFSSMKLSKGAFQTGPFKKQTKESKTQALSSSSIVSWTIHG